MGLYFPGLFWLSKGSFGIFQGYQLRLGLSLWLWMASPGLILLWFLACCLLLSPSSYRAGLKSHMNLEGFSHSTTLCWSILPGRRAQWTTEQGLNHGHLSSLTNSGNGSWPTSLEDSFTIRRESFSFCFPGHHRGKKPSLPRAASPPECELWDRDTAGLVLALALLLSWETTTMLTKGKPCQLWNCWVHHKTEMPNASKFAEHQKHSLLSPVLWFLLLHGFDPDCFNLLMPVVTATGMSEISAPHTSNLRKRSSSHL